MQLPRSFADQELALPWLNKKKTENFEDSTGEGNKSLEEISFQPSSIPMFSVLLLQSVSLAFIVT
jgi:hypothetical protein